MPKVVRFHETGGPEVLKFEDVPPQPPGKVGPIEGASDWAEPCRVNVLSRTVYLSAEFARRTRLRSGWNCGGRRARCGRELEGQAGLDHSGFFSKRIQHGGRNCRGSD